MITNRVNKISYNYHIQSFRGEPKKERHSFPDLSKYAPYTLENMHANYMLSPVQEKPTLKTILKKHNLPKDILRQYGYKEEDVSQEMIEVFDKLNPKVTAHIQSVDKKGDLIPKLLTQTDEFETFWDYKGIPNLLNLLNMVEVNGETLLSQLNNFSFLADEDFDVTEWDALINLLDNKKSGEEKTYLERFLGDNSFAELFYSKDFSPSDIIAAREKIEFSIGMSKFNPDRFFEILDLIVGSDDTKYNKQERTQTLNYFMDLKDNEGHKLFNSSNPRLSKISTYKYLMNIDPTSVDASNMQMLIELVQAGVVGKHIFEYLPLDGKISPNISADIDKLYDAYINGIKPIDKFIPTYKTIEKAHSELKTGDVYEIEGEELLYIISNEHSSTQIKLTKQKFFELFPPIERYGTTQNEIGNCWEISVLQGLYSNPNTRHIVLNLFSQSGDDIIVKYPKGGYGEVIFDNGTLPEEEDIDAYSQGAKGFQLLEHADGKEVQDAKIREYEKYLTVLAKTDAELAQLKKSELEEMLAYYGSEYTRVEYNYKENEWIVEEYKKPPFGYNSIEVEGRDGGYALNLLHRIGFKTTDELMLDEEETAEFLKNLENLNSSTIIWTTKHDEDLCESHNLTDGHAYFLSGANVDSNGNIIDYNIINPWGIVVQRLTLEELKEYGSAIIYGKN